MMAFWPRFEPSPGLVAEWHRRLPDLLCPGFRLREPRLGDAERLAAAFGPEAASTLGVATPATGDEWMHFVARVRTGRATRHTVCYAVVPEASADVGGLVLLQRLAPKSRAATVSFVFSEAHWGTDLPAVSSACVLAFAFQAVGVSRVEGRASGAREFETVRRLGAVIEGVLRHSQPVGDGFADQILWSVLDTDWVRPDHSASNLLVHVEQEHPLSGGPTGRGDVERPAWTVRLPTLEGSVVTLREIDQLDVPAFLDVLEPADLEVAFEPAPSTPDEFRRYVLWIQLQRSEGRAAGFAIVPRGARQAAGLLQIRLADLPGAIAEWGIVLASSHRGMGAASEAARLVAGFAFETLGVNRLETRASGITPGSIRLLRKLGAVREAHLRKSFAHGSEVVDDDLWAILKSDWYDPHKV